MKTKTVSSGIVQRAAALALAVLLSGGFAHNLAAAGWFVTQRKNAETETNIPPSAVADATLKFNVQFHDPRPNGGRRSGGGGQAAAVTNAPTGTNTTGTNATVTAQAPRGNRGGGRNRVPNLADLDFKDGVLTAFKWNN